MEGIVHLRQASDKCLVSHFPIFQWGFGDESYRLNLVGDNPKTTSLPVVSARRALLTGASFINLQCASAKIVAVEGLDGGVCFFVVIHGYETKAL